MCSAERLEVCTLIGICDRGKVQQINSRKSVCTFHCLLNGIVKYLPGTRMLTKQLLPDWKHR